MANEKNLIPFDQQTESEQREKAKKGGQASGRARRTKRDVQKAFQDFLNNPNLMPQTRAVLQQLGYDPETVTNFEGLLAGLYKGVMKGNPQAISMLLQYAGMDPVQEQKNRESKARAELRRRAL